MLYELHVEIAVKAKVVVEAPSALKAREVFERRSISTPGLALELTHGVLRNPDVEILIDVVHDHAVPPAPKPIFQVHDDGEITERR